MTEAKVKAKKKKGPGGAPTKYKPEYNEQAQKLCKLGAKDTQLADFFKVDKATINNWKSEHPEFFVSIKAGKDYWDNEAIEESLCKKAMGYMITETRTEKSGDEFKEVTINKHVPASDTAMIYWLNNRSRGRFKQKQEIEHSGEVTTFNMQFGGVKDD